MQHSQDQLQGRKLKGDRKYGDIPKSTAKQSVYQNASAIKDEPVDISNENKSDQAYVDVKNEPGNREDMTTEGDSVDVVEEVRSSDAATIKQELDIGATVLQPPDMHFMLQPCKPEPADTTPQASTIPQHRRSHYSEGEQAVRLTESSGTCSQYFGQVNIDSGSQRNCDVYSKHCSLQLNLSNLKIKNGSVKNALIHHLRIHSDERSFQCYVCNKRFGRIISLINHLKIHMDKRLYSCDVCSKSYTEKSYLSRHLKIHTGERPFICEVCSKSYTEKSFLQDI